MIIFGWLSPIAWCGASRGKEMVGFFEEPKVLCLVLSLSFLELYWISCQSWETSVNFLLLINQIYAIFLTDCLPQYIFVYLGDSFFLIYIILLLIKKKKIFPTNLEVSGGLTLCNQRSFKSQKLGPIHF